MSLAPLTILVAEDVHATQKLLEKFLKKLGHNVLMANNGHQAIELYQQHQPDIILIDIHMPVMNGLEAIKKIRGYPNDFWVPILVLSASDENEDIISGLSAGADDYLPKPIELDILKAKIDAMQRHVILQKENLAQKRSLKGLNIALEEEQILAKELADRMLVHGSLDAEQIDYWLQPNKYFSGDLIAAAETVDHKLFVLLADSTGHGLAASLATLSVARTFHSMVKKGFSLSSIVTEMNTSIKELLPADRFVATNLFLVDFKNQSIESWCGGNPEAIILNKKGDIVHKLKSSHLAIGILPEKDFDSSTNLWRWTEPVELISYSDGIPEAEDLKGSFFGEQRLITELQSHPSGERINKVKLSVQSYLMAEQGQDDISIVSIFCDT